MSKIRQYIAYAVFFIYAIALIFFAISDAWWDVIALLCISAFLYIVIAYFDVEAENE
jgi:hypothetical protein